jgi:tRNA pseudouridine55 synthase
LASGLLILCTGKFTKKIEEFSNLNKEYIAKINFGASRPSFDKETEIDNQYETSHISEQLLIDTLKTFEGKQMQMPPIYSAKKINGEKAYINARKGRDVEVRPNEVEIYSINLIETKLPETATIKMDVSKGTYIRSFANDLGKKLNSGAYLDELERTKIGNYNIKDSYTIESFTEFLNNL